MGARNDEVAAPWRCSPLGGMRDGDAMTGTIAFHDLAALLRDIFLANDTSAEVAGILAANCAGAERDAALSHGVFRVAGYVSTLKKRLGRRACCADGGRGRRRLHPGRRPQRLRAAGARGRDAAGAGPGARRRRLRRLDPAFAPFRGSVARHRALRRARARGAVGREQHGGRGAARREPAGLWHQSDGLRDAAGRGVRPSSSTRRSARWRMATCRSRPARAVCCRTARASTATVAPTRDPKAILDGGALLPFGGHKGSSLALMIEVLSAALSGGLYSYEVDWSHHPGARTPCTGQCLILIDPARGGHACGLHRPGRAPDRDARRCRTGTPAGRAPPRSPSPRRRARHPARRGDARGAPGDAADGVTAWRLGHEPP